MFAGEGCKAGRRKRCKSSLSSELAEGSDLRWSPCAAKLARRLLSARLFSDSKVCEKKEVAGDLNRRCGSRLSLNERGKEVGGLGLS